MKILETQIPSCLKCPLANAVVGGKLYPLGDQKSNAVTVCAWGGEFYFYRVIHLNGDASPDFPVNPPGWCPLPDRK